MRLSVFPALAGMNRRHGRAHRRLPGVPRARGDEPEIDKVKEQAQACSPRSRG